MPGAKSHHERSLLMLLASLLIRIAHCQVAGSQCYDFDGSVIQGDSPCNPDAHESICCGEFWTCLNGVCSDQNTTQEVGSGETLLARATCTDPTWQSSVCPRFCLNNLGRGITTFPGNDSFCCQADLDQPCYEDPKVKTLNLGMPLTTISIIGAPTSTTPQASATRSSTSSTKALTSSRSRNTDTSTKTKVSASSTNGPALEAQTTFPSSSSTALPTAAATSSSSQSNGLSQGATIGLAVGVTLGVIAIIAALLFIWYKKRERRKRLGGLEGKSELPATSQAPGKGYYAPGHPGAGQTVQELDDPANPRVFGELPAGSQIPRAEMGG